MTKRYLCIGFQKMTSIFFHKFVIGILGPAETAADHFYFSINPNFCLPVFVYKSVYRKLIDITEI